MSRYLFTASQSYKEIWAHAYLKADSVRPPGPFSFQSTSDLENTLNTSFRIDQILQSNPVRPQKLREITFTGNLINVNLVFGRFLLIAPYEEVRCRDLDSLDINLDGRVIYRPTTGIIKSFSCVSAADVSGCPFACVVVQEGVVTDMRSQL